MHVALSMVENDIFRDLVLYICLALKLIFVSSGITI
jgi:hypothetical protein